MKNAHRFITLSTMVVSLAWAGTASAQTPEARDLASNCFQCHGTDGHAVRGMPSIEGGSDAVEALMEFRRSTEFKKIMTRHARGYNDEQIRLIGEYFQSVSGNGGGDNGGD